MDLDEAMRGILLLGGGEGESEKCALLLSSKLKHAPIDVKGMLSRFEEAERQHRLQQTLELAQATEGGSSVSLAGASVPIANPDIDGAEKPLQIDSYQPEVKQYIDEEMRARGARGFVLFNWEFTARDTNRLIGVGFPVDSTIDMQTPAPPPPPKLPASGASATSSSLTNKQPASSSRAQATPSSSPAKPSTTSSRAPSTASRSATTATSGPAAAAKSPPKPTPISSNSSPSRASSRQAPPKTPELKKRPVETPSKQSQQKAPPTPTGKRPTATSATSLKSAAPFPEKKPAKVDRKAQFKGMLHQITPASFPEERVQCILSVLEEQKEQRAAPFVQWDEATQQTNEMLAMFAEDVHMMIHVQQENRKPKKPGDLVPPASSSTGSGGASKPANSPLKTAASSVSSTARSKAKSPVKPTPTARGSEAAAAAMRAPGASVPASVVFPKCPEQRSPDRSKRASVSTSSPSASPGKLKKK